MKGDDALMMFIFNQMLHYKKLNKYVPDNPIIVKALHVLGISEIYSLEENEKVTDLNVAYMVATSGNIVRAMFGEALKDYLVVAYNAWQKTYYIMNTERTGIEQVGGDDLNTPLYYFLFPRFKRSLEEITGLVKDVIRNGVKGVLEGGGRMDDALTGYIQARAKFDF